MARDSLLIVDDDAVFCRVLGRALRRRGFDVREALTLQAATDMLNAEPPAYMVLDLRVDDQSSLRLINTALGKAPDIAIVVLTGFASIATAVEAVKRGARNYLAKPADANEVMAALGGELRKLAGSADDRPLSVRKLEWEHIQRVLQEHDGNVSATARALHMHRRTLQRKLQKKPVKQ